MSSLLKKLSVPVVCTTLFAASRYKVNVQASNDTSESKRQNFYVTQKPFWVQHNYRWDEFRGVAFNSVRLPKKREHPRFSKLKSVNYGW